MCSTRNATRPVPLTIKLNLLPFNRWLMSPILPLHKTPPASLSPLRYNSQITPYFAICELRLLICLWPPGLCLLLARCCLALVVVEPRQSSFVTLAYQSGSHTCHYVWPWHSTSWASLRQYSLSHARQSEHSRSRVHSKSSVAQRPHERRVGEVSRRWHRAEKHIKVTDVRAYGGHLIHHYPPGRRVWHFLCAFT